MIVVNGMTSSDHPNDARANGVMSKYVRTDSFDQSANSRICAFTGDLEACLDCAKIRLRECPRAATQLAEPCCTADSPFQTFL